MPNLFFSGSVEFSVKGSPEQVKDLKSAIKSNEQGIKFVYEINELPCTFYLHPFHLVKGSFSVEPVGDAFKANFDGIAKIPVDKPTFDYLTGKDFKLYIEGLYGDRYIVSVDGDSEKKILCPLKVSKTAPK